MNKQKVALMIFLIIYVLSPIDACPGPIDDIIAVMLGLAAQRKMSC